MRIAIHDLGSQSFHLLCARVDATGAIIAEASHKHSVRLGASTDPFGRIHGDAWERGLVAVGELARAARAFGGETFAIGTSVLREAPDGGQFARAAAERLGVPVQILSGDEEAELVFLGALSALPADIGTVAVVDLGGGSLEIAVGDTHGPRLTRSMPLGTLRMRGLGWDAVVERVHELGDDAWRAARRLAPRAVVLTGGSARLLARMCGLPSLDSELVRSLGRGLEGLADVQRLAAGVPIERVDTIVPSAAILSTVVAELGGTATISSRGVREGFVVARRRATGC